MRRFVLIALIVAFSATAADARRRHHHHRWHGAPVMMLNPDMPDAEMPRDMRGLDAPQARRNSSFIPADWKLQPEDPNFSGRRYMAPDGSAWLALYSAPADKEAHAAHLKNVA